MDTQNKITIDPGLAGTGYAIWTPDWNLVTHGVVESRAEEFERKGLEISGELRRRVVQYECIKAFIEFPALFQSAGGRVTASSGALVKLTWFVGLACGRIRIPFELVKVNDWKGQLPKSVVIKRIQKRLPNCRAKSHDWDAIGIGLYKAGRF